VPLAWTCGRKPPDGRDDTRWLAHAVARPFNLALLSGLRRTHRAAVGQNRLRRPSAGKSCIPSEPAGAHNGAVTDGQVTDVCPQCGSAAGVHSIQELAALAQSRLSSQQQPFGGVPQQGYGAEPQAGPLPGYAAEPRSGPMPGSGWQGSTGMRDSVGDLSLGDDLAGLAMGAASRFIGRAIGRRVQRTVTERVMPAVAAKQQEALRTQIAVAERHPDLRACLTDKVIFVAGGSRVLPMPSLTAGLTLEQSDELVARLRDG
jgi:hypothetical protein